MLPWIRAILLPLFAGKQATMAAMSRHFNWGISLSFARPIISKLINFFYFPSYRIAEQGNTEWKTIRVPPPETTNTFTLYNLQSDNEYEFQVYAVNRLGAGSPSPIIKASTKRNLNSKNLNLENLLKFFSMCFFTAWSFGENIYPTDASGATYIPTVQKPSG